MTIDKSISESAINANERAVIEKYNFDVSTDGNRFVVTDSAYRKANRGKGGKYVGGNIELLLVEAVEQHKTLDLVASAPSDKVKPNGSQKPGVVKKAAVSASSTGNSDSAKVTTTQTSTDASRPQSTPGLEPDATFTGRLTSKQQNLVSVYHLTVTRASDEWVVDDEAVRKHYAFKDASKKGNYGGADLDKLLEVAIGVHETMIAEKSGATNGKKKAAAGKADSKQEKPAKEPKERKDSRYTRAAKILVKQPGLDDKKLARLADMSESTAGHCLDAWKSITAVLVANGWLDSKHLQTK